MELLVVLLLLGLLAGVGFPQLQKTFASYEYAEEKRQVLANLTGLTEQSIKNFVDFDLLGQPVDTKTLAGDWGEYWQIYIEKPIHFYKSGSCSGGELWIIDKTNKSGILYELLPPFCIQLSVIRKGGLDELGINDKFEFEK